MILSEESINTNDLGTTRLQTQLQELRDDAQAMATMSRYITDVVSGDITQAEFTKNFNKYRSIKSRFLQGD
jgi:hypothetical protein